MNQVNKRCQIQTPIIYVRQLLDQAGYQTNLYGKKVLENSFGEGNILCEIVYRYIQDGIYRNFSCQDIKSGLERNIIGYETDLACVESSRKRLDDLANKYGINNVKWDLRNRDFLKDKIESVDYIIGNPPYVTYHDLNKQQRTFLKEHFQSCQKGRFDYYYAFIERSLSWLRPAGKFVYLVPYSILTNKYALNLRRILSYFLKEIIDLRRLNVFTQVMCTPIIIICQNIQSNNNIMFSEAETGVKSNIIKQDFIEPTQKNNAVSTAIRVNNSVATLKNQIFVFPVTQFDGKYYFIDKFKVEKEITKNAVSPRSITLGKHMRAIFPYRYDGGKLRPLSEEELQNNYPYAYNYLINNKKLLLERNLQKHVQWYEYGRHQALDLVFQSKIIMPNVITKKNHVHVVIGETVPYAGICITLAKNELRNRCIEKELSKIKSILESRDFLEFLMKKGTPTVGKSLRISVSIVQEYLSISARLMNQ